MSVVSGWRDVEGDDSSRSYLDQSREVAAYDLNQLPGAVAHGVFVEDTLAGGLTHLLPFAVMLEQIAITVKRLLLRSERR